MLEIFCWFHDSMFPKESRDIFAIDFGWNLPIFFICKDRFFDHVDAVSLWLKSPNIFHF